LGQVGLALGDPLSLGWRIEDSVIVTAPEGEE